MTAPKSKQGFWWLKVPVAQHVTDMAGMSLKEQGIYQQLMWIAFERGSLPTDTGKLARLIGCTPEEVETVIDPDIAGRHFTFGVDEMHHAAIEIEREKAAERSEKSRRKQKAGNDKRWPKDTVVTDEGHCSDLQGSLANSNCNSPEVPPLSPTPKTPPNAETDSIAQAVAISCREGLTHDDN